MKLPITTLLLLILALCLPLACGDDDDDDDDTPTGDDDTADDDDTTDDDDDTVGQPKGACLCCFIAEEQIWSWCYNLGVEAECAPGCSLLYDEEHLAGTLYEADTACLDADGDAECRESFNLPS